MSPVPGVMAHGPVAEIEGHVEGRFARVAETFARSLDTGADIGGSVAVFLEGEPVVDIWGGHQDPARTVSWERDTIVNVFSTTKTITTLCALLLADCGEIDLHAPVAKYWPEFAQAGKNEIELRHVLGHTAGMAGFEADMVVEDLADWERCTTLLAAQRPLWAPGTRSGYHALTQGYLIGEVVRRVTGLSLGQCLAQNVAEPLRADFHIRVPQAAEPRVAPLIPPPDEDVEAAELPEIARRALRNPPLSREATHSRWWRAAEIPAANGHGNARSVGAIQSIVSCGGEARGIRLLSSNGVNVIFEEQSNGRDLVLGVPMRFGIGFGLASESMPIGPRSCQWGGYGGSFVLNDLDARLTIAYVMNRLLPGLQGDLRGAAIIASARDSLAPRYRRVARWMRRRATAVRGR